MTLKQICKERHLSVRELAQICEMPYSTMNDIINGKRDILDLPLRTCLKITKALKIDLDQLMASDPLEELRLKGINVYVKNQSYFYVPEDDHEEGPIRICKVNQLNTFFLEDMIESKQLEIKRREEAEKAWTLITS